MPSSPLPLPLTIIHWILLLEAIYCFVFVGLAFAVGEGFSTALDIFIRILSFREGPQAAALLYVYPVFVIGVSTAKTRLTLFPWSR